MTSNAFMLLNDTVMHAEYPLFIIRHKDYPRSSLVRPQLLCDSLPKLNFKYANKLHTSLWGGVLDNFKDTLNKGMSSKYSLKALIGQEFQAVVTKA